MRLAVLSALALAALAACTPPRPDATPDGGDDGDGGDGDGGETVAPIRACGAHVAYRATGSIESVAVAGAWDWAARTPLTDPDADGLYTADLDLAAGVHAYKIVVTRPGGNVEWLLDADNPYRTYDGGVENSGARVADCSVPLLEVTSHATAAAGSQTHLRISRAADGAAIAGVRARIVFEGGVTATAPTVTVAAGDVTITTAGLTPGKHTIVVDADDAAGHAALAVRIPFWIESEAFDWRDALIYMVMTDRFRNGNPANDPGPTSGAEAAADYLGGDLRGVTAAIEDGTFDQLGVRTLWLSPFVENTTDVEQEDGHGVTAYHGYWPTRARTIDPRLGTPAELDAMVTAAHRHGIRVLMDYVINHVHADHEYVGAHPSWFRVGCTCGENNCGWTEHRLDCSFHPYMPDVDWTNREAGEQMITDALWWLERYDLDGLRVDAVKHVEDLAVGNLSTRIHEAFESGNTEYFLLGETAMGWNGDDVAANLSEYETISRYVGPDALSGQFDFVLYHATAYRVWADDARGMLHLDYWTQQSLAHYPADAVMTPFVGSHDSERLLSLADLGSGSALVHHKWASQGLPTVPTDDEPYQRAAIALTWMLSVPGAPLLYYGDEYGEHGGADPDNRHMWKAPAQRSAREAALYERVARAGRLRRELVPMRRGRYVPLTVTEDVLTFARVLGNQAVVVAVNRAATSRSVEVDLTSLGAVAVNGALVDRLDPAAGMVTVTGGRVTVNLGARSAMVLAAPP